MRVLVCGGREYTDVQRIFTILDRYHEREPITEIIEGCARGADQIAEIWADRNGVPCSHHPANWQKYGRAAGPKRNREMARQEPDLVLAFPVGELENSKGTRDMVSVARDRGIPYVVFDREG